MRSNFCGFLDPEDCDLEPVPQIANDQGSIIDEEEQAPTNDEKFSDTAEPSARHASV
jgi:hypothetical protein